MVIGITVLSVMPITYGEGMDLKQLKLFSAVAEFGGF
jgi:hypothetical protein